MIHAIGGQVIDTQRLQEFCQSWCSTNQKYFQVYHEWQDIHNSLTQGINQDISYITDLHSQGYINYCIERDYHVTIPVYDYRDWFTSTDQIKEMIQGLSISEAAAVTNLRMLPWKDNLMRQFNK
jgi:hypothetical protein